MRVTAGYTIFIIILILLSTTTIAQENDYNNYDNLLIGVKLDANFSIVPTGSNPSIKEVKSTLSLFPKTDTLQKIEALNYYSAPNAQILEDSQKVDFLWSSPIIGDYNMGFDSRVSVKNLIITIDEKVPFPLDIEDDSYTKPTEYIDINDDIRAKAQELAYGEDDLYAVSFKVGEWVEQNIDYDLNTLTADAVQKSSWVMQNKVGVCDELTNLFISMMRSLGVPARFVSGLAYSNIGYEWVPHGWAEVYFPDKGWVPFDVTFKQFGWIDPSHIKLKVSEDSGKSAVSYSWTSTNTNIGNKEISLSAYLINKGEKIYLQDFEVRPLKNNVGPGSYVPIEVEINNEFGYYTPMTFTVTKAPKLTEDNQKAALLKPLGVKKVFWIVEIPENTKQNFIYKTTVEVEDQFHTNKSAVINYAENLDVISLEEAERLIEEANIKEERVISMKVDVDCEPEVYLYSYQKTQISCLVKNKGNTNLLNVVVCLEEKECRNINLDIAEEKEVAFDLEFKPGISTLEVSAQYENEKSSDIIDVNLLENPGLRISDIEYPEVVSYNEDFDISLNLLTEAPVKEVNININGQNVIYVESMEISKKGVIHAKGKDFYKDNKIIIQTSYKDVNDQSYESNAEYFIQVTNAPWYIKILRFLGLA